MSLSNLGGRHIGRRGLMRAGGVATAALIAGAGSLPAAAPAGAALPNSFRFHLPGAGDNPVWKKSLHANWVMQSFAYDNTRQHIYFLQCSPDQVNQRGYMQVTKTDVYGKKLGWMMLRGFGHGVSIGVEPSGGGVHLWTETHVNPNGAFGTRVGRFPFVHDTSIDSAHASIQNVTPRIRDTVSSPQAAIDPYHQRVAYRYSDGTSHRIVVFTLADARAGEAVENDTTDNRLAERRLPTHAELGLDPKDQAFQGWTFCGRYAYLLYGSVNKASYIATVDLNASGGQHFTPVHRSGTGISLPGREAQGMAIWMPTGAGPRLAFGYHSNTDGVRQSSVFYKNEFV